MNYQNETNFTSQMYVSRDYCLPREHIDARQYGIESSYPQGSENKQVMPSYPAYPMQNEQEMLSDGVKEDATSVQPTASYGGSGRQQDQDNAVTMNGYLDRDEAASYEPQTLEGFGFNTGTERYAESSKTKCDASAVVLRQLDYILRKKIHLEFDEFQATLDELLDGYMEHIYHLFNLSQATDTEIFCTQQDHSRTGFRQDERHEIKIISNSMEMDFLCYKFLASMFVSANAINAVLKVERKNAI